MHQILLTLFSYFFEAHQSQTENGLGAITHIKDTIRAEFSSLILKTLAGVVLASIIIYSFIQFGEGLQALFEQYEFGLQFEIVTFAAIFLASVASLVYLFRDRKPLFQTPTEIRANGIDLQTLISHFTEGLTKGYQEAAQARPPARTASQNPATPQGQFEFKASNQQPKPLQAEN